VDVETAKRKVVYRRCVVYYDRTETTKQVGVDVSSVKYDLLNTSQLLWYDMCK
jgi:hypothetical protein